MSHPMFWCVVAPLLVAAFGGCSNAPVRAHTPKTVASVAVADPCVSAPVFLDAERQRGATPGLENYDPQRGPADEQQRRLVEQLVSRYLTVCGLDEAIALTAAMVEYPTVSAEVDDKSQRAFEGLAKELREYAEGNGMRFEEFGVHDAWEISYGSGAPSVGFVMHADVVPVAKRVAGADGQLAALPPGWDHPPFELTQVDGKLYGRGTEDDKGPIAAVLVVFRAMQRFGLKPHGKLMALIGNGEESDWDGMERYVASRQHAPKVISVDAGYPVVVAESGFVRWELLLPPSQAVANDDCLEPVDVHAGEFLTQVPQVARLTIAAEGDVEDKLGRLQSAADREGAHRGAGWPLSAAREAGSLVLQAEGLAVHSSTAPDGRNALWALARAAQELELCPGAVRSMLELVARYLADDHWGQKLGLVQRDPLMGRLLVIPTMIRSDDKGVLLRVNMRRPAPMSSADFNRELDAVLARLAARYPRLHEPTDRYVGEPAWVDPSSRLVQTLLAIYREETGDDEAVPIAIRGGTYARLFEGAVSFGPSLPGKPYRGHAPNEYLEVDALALLINSLYKAAIRLDAPR